MPIIPCSSNFEFPKFRWWFFSAVISFLILVDLLGLSLTEDIHLLPIHWALRALKVNADVQTSLFNHKSLQLKLLLISSGIHMPQNVLSVS